jgi:hypothetical protein
MASKLLGKADVTVTATPARVTLPGTSSVWTLTNTHSQNAFYYRRDTAETSVLTAGGADAVLQAAGWIRVDPGRAAIITDREAVDWIDVVSATGLASSVRARPGFADSAAAELLASVRGSLPAIGTITLSSNASEGDTITIDDGIADAVVYEFDVGVKATGVVEFTDQPADGETLTVGDGAASVVFEFDSGSAAVGNIALAGQPSDGDTVTIGDGATSVIFEFDDDASITGDVTVTIGGDVDATIANLIAAIEGSALTIDAEPGAGDSVDLTHDSVGDAGNVAITKSGGNITVSGMAGGADAGDDVTGGNVGVAIGATASDTADNLATAIGTTALTIDAAPGAGDTVDLTHQSYAAAGNVAMSTTAANITPTGMAGGADPGTAITGGNVGVAVGGTASASCDNLIVAINANQRITATAGDGDSVDLVHQVEGDDYNITITTTGLEIVVTGMSGGADKLDWRTMVARLADLADIETATEATQAACEALADLISGDRLLVDASGVTLTADIVQADMDAVTGTAPNSKNLYDLWTLLDAPAQAGEAAAATADLATGIGATDDAASDATGTGSLSAKLRAILATLQDDSVGSFVPGSAAYLLSLIKDAAGATDDDLVAAGAVGSLSAKLRRLTTDLDALNDALTAAGDGTGDAPGVMLADIETATEATQAACEGPTAVAASAIYDGGGADNALQEAATETAFSALGTTPDPIALTAASNAIRVFLASATASDDGVLCVGQFDADGNLLEVNEVTIAASDQTFDLDRDAFGLTTGTDIAAKPPVIVTFARHASTAVLKLWMSDDGTGPWYARYQLLAL